MFVDTHAHLFYPNFKEDLKDVVIRAKQAGVHAIIVPSTDLASCAQTIDLTKQYDMVYGALGVHPHDSREWDDEMLKTLKDLVQNNKKIVAIGEIGLDYYYDYSPKEKQIEAFRAQIELALDLDLPVIVHNRESNDDVMNIMREYCKSGLRAQMHCFSGDEKDAYELMKMGYFISFTGNVTFKKREDIRTIAASVAPDHLLLETDSPFMTPVPHRGKRNEPAFLTYTVEQLAELYHLSVEDLARVTTFNVHNLFGIGDMPEKRFTYKIRNSLYINVTNRCNADCVFCSRKNAPYVSGYNLSMPKSEEPDANTYIQEIGDPTQYDEIVFCGYGEPTIRWDVVKDIAKAVKAKGGKTRLNTNGHGNTINKKDIVPEMKGLIDAVSISLNATTSQQYAELMRVSEDMYDEMKKFATKAKDEGVRVILSVVSYDGVDIEASRKIAEEELGVEFRTRHYF